MADPDYQALANQGVAALQRGDAKAARAAFEAIAEAGRASHQLWLLLAQSCEMLGDAPAMQAALDPVLQAEPKNLYALLMRGEQLARTGDDRAASAWFNMAVASAGGFQSLPPDLQPRLERARAALAAADERFSAHLRSSLSAAGVDTGKQGRLAEALDILEGRAQPQLQQPTSFYYPRLPAIPFFDPADFDWVPALAAAAADMRAEAQAVLASGEGLAPYVEADPTRPNKGHALLGKADWSAFYLWQNGAPVSEHARRCPVTAAALERLPMPRTDGRSPTALFSILKPHTHIPPHWGMINTRLICHIPLIVPEGCRLRVGNETRAVEFGKALIFDDSIEHEAWNDSDETRLILLFEIWRPELDAGERRALATMFEAIGRY
jgi:Aspartyl/Asparaginyl beta-hydroxylase